MWVIPVGLCIRNQWYRFPLIWFIFSVVTSFITKKSLEKPIEVEHILFNSDDLNICITHILTPVFLIQISERE